MRKIGRWHELFFIKDSKGFTIIEVLIALSILLIALFPIHNLFMSALQNFNSAGERSQLVRAGEAVMERIIAGENYIPDIEKKYNTIGSEKNIYYCIETNDFTYNETEIKKIQVKVYWENCADNCVCFTTLKR
jgi:prepilin-type N-terminal cleavage/methylation domain-containing protein